MREMLWVALPEEYSVVGALFCSELLSMQNKF